MNAIIEQKDMQATTIFDDRPAPPSLPLTPMDMLHQAVSRGADISILEKLMALQERWEANQARRAFDEAMADAKAEIPTILKNRQVFYPGKGGASGTSYRHEDLGEIAHTVDHILSKHGLSYRWRTKSPIGQPIEVTCIVSHRAGHFEENSLVAGRDESGSKNAIQSVGSAITYLQRYTLKAALGLAASNDDDGKGVAVSEETISESQAGDLIAFIEEVGTNKTIFLQYFNVEKISDLPAAKYDLAIRKLEAKRGQK